MHEALLVRVVQRRGDVDQDAQRLQRFQCTARLEPPFEVTATDVLHGDVVMLLGDPDVVDTDDMRVRELRDRLTFLDKTLRECLVGGQRRRHHLERYRTIERFLRREKDGRHASVAKFALDPIARYLGHSKLRKTNRNGLAPSMLTIGRLARFLTRMGPALIYADRVP